MIVEYKETNFILKLNNYITNISELHQDWSAISNICDSITNTY